MLSSAELGPLLATSYATVSAAAGAASDRHLLKPSGCAGWSAADLLVHLLGDTRRCLVGLATPEPGPADTDAIEYWRPIRAERDLPAPSSKAHAQHIRRLAVAYSSPSSIVREWNDTAGAAGRAAIAADPSGFVSTQGHVLAVPDFIATLAVEATIHLLDLRVALPAAQPPAEAVNLAAGTMSALAGISPDSGFSPEELIGLITGRREISAAARQSLGPLADSLPLQL